MPDFPDNLVKDCLGPCGRTLPANLKHFSRQKNGKFGLRSRCKDCIAEENASWYSLCSPEKKAERSKRSNTWRRKNRTRVTNNYLKREYGITIEEYNSLIEQQDGVCAICKGTQTCLDRSRNPKSLVVDHDHKTGEIRGLLCDHCNHLLGMAKDDISILISAIQYLRSYVVQFQ